MVTISKPLSAGQAQAYHANEFTSAENYASTLGRFTTADPYMASGGPSDPGSWNRYSYTRGDPVNRNDPHGLFDDGSGDDGDQGSLAERGNDFGNGFGDGSFPGGDGVPNPCSQITGMGFLGNVVCNGGVPVYVFEPPASPAAPSCSISLYERPVGVSVVGLFADHTYLLIQDSIGTSTIEGGPDLVNVPLGYLIGTSSTPPGKGLAGTDPRRSDNKQVGNTDSGASVCDLARDIENTESRYNTSGAWAKYDPLAVLGYNSNSFTYTLLKDVGLSTFFGPTLGWTPGWGQSVPGLR